jgi:hypothetical protein
MATIIEGKYDNKCEAVLHCDQPTTFAIYCLVCQANHYTCKKHANYLTDIIVKINRTFVNRIRF